MEIMKKRFIALTLLLFTFSSANFSKEKDKANLNRFQWNNISIQLPFSPEWAITKPRKNPYDPLNFMNPDSPAPRIIANLSQTNFELSTKDFSAFKDEFLKSKVAWIEKSEGEILEKPIFTFTKEKMLLKYEYSFAIKQEKFKEFGHFQRCTPKIAFSLRVMIPQSKIKAHPELTTEIIDFFRNSSACIH